MSIRKPLFVLLPILLLLLPIGNVQASGPASLTFESIPDEIQKDVPFKVTLKFESGELVEQRMSSCEIYAGYTQNVSEREFTTHASPIFASNLKMTSESDSVEYSVPEGDEVYFSSIGLQLINIAGPDGSPDYVPLSTGADYSLEFDFITLADREDIPANARVRETDQVYLKVACGVHDGEDNSTGVFATETNIIDIVPPTPEPQPEAGEETPDQSETNNNADEILLPKVFTKKDSTTTDFSEFGDEELSGVQFLTFEDIDHGKVVYANSVDLSAAGVKELLADLDDFLEFKHGKIILDSKAFLELDAEADVFLYNLNLAPSDITILKDGRTEPGITRVDYSDGILSFRVPSFSTYAVAPGVELDTIPEETTENEIIITGKISDLDSDFIVFAGGEIVEVEPVVNEDGTFSLSLTLEEISNEFEIIVKSVSGEEDQASFKIIREPANTLLGIDLDNPLLVFVAAALLILVVLIVGTLLAILGNRRRNGNGQKKEDANYPPERPKDPTMNMDSALKETRLPNQKKEEEPSQFLMEPCEEPRIVSMQDTEVEESPSEATGEKTESDTP